MTTPNKRHAPPREPYFGPPCLGCGYTLIVVPCSREGCERWSICCPACPDSDLDRCAESNGRCPYCREQ